MNSSDITVLDQDHCPNCGEHPLLDTYGAFCPVYGCDWSSADGTVPTKPTKNRPSWLSWMRRPFKTKTRQVTVA